jgi:hypothetical protein
MTAHAPNQGAPTAGDYLTPLECAIEACGLWARETAIRDAYRSNPKLPDWPDVRDKLAEVNRAIVKGDLASMRLGAGKTDAGTGDTHDVLRRALYRKPDPEPLVNRYDLREWVRRTWPYEALTHERDMLKRQVADLEARLAAAEKERDRLKRKLKPKPDVEPRREATYLHAIGALLALLTGKSAQGKPNSDFQTVTAVKAAVKHRFGNVSGLATRTLDGLFAEASERLKDPD